MKFNKKHLCTAISTALALTICSGIAVAKTHSISNKSINSAVITNSYTNDSLKSSKLNNRVIQENGVYYILCDGASESDKPVAGVTDGDIGFVLVRKDSYTSIGPFNDMSKLVAEVTEQCNTMLEKKYITQDELNTVIELATKIKSGDIQSSDKSNKTNSYDKEYAEWGIEKIDGAYYYNNERVRIFMDLRADNSFETFNYDKKNGTIDLKVERNKDGDIISVSYIKKQEVNKILEDIDSSHLVESQKGITEKETKIIEDIERLVIEKAPNNIQEAINSLEDNKWYVIESDGREYIYYNNLPYNYAYQYEQDKNNLIILDIGKSTDNYVLLSIPQGSDLTITYNSKQISYIKTAL